MSSIDELDNLADEGKVTFTHDGTVWVVVEASSEGLFAKEQGKENDPYASATFEWSDLPFTAAGLVAKHRKEMS